MNKIKINMNKSNTLNNDDKEYRDLTQYLLGYCVRTTYKQDGTMKHRK